MPLPDATDRGLADVLSLGHRPGAPVGGLRRSRVQGRFNHGFYLPRRNAGKPARPGRIFFQTWDTEGQKTFPPQLNGWPRDSQILGDILTPPSSGRRKNDLGSLDETKGKAPGFGPAVEGGLFLGREND